MTIFGEVAAILTGAAALLGAVTRLIEVLRRLPKRGSDCVDHE